MSQRVGYVVCCLPSLSLSLSLMLLTPFFFLLTKWMMLTMLVTVSMGAMLSMLSMLSDADVDVVVSPVALKAKWSGTIEPKAMNRIYLGFDRQNVQTQKEEKNKERNDWSVIKIKTTFGVHDDFVCSVPRSVISALSIVCPDGIIGLRWRVHGSLMNNKYVLMQNRKKRKTKMQAHGRAPTVSPSRALCRRRGERSSRWVGARLSVEHNNQRDQGRWRFGRSGRSMMESKLQQNNI